MQDDFRFWRLGLGSRLALSAGLFAVGAFLEVALFVPLGAAVAILGWSPLALRRATNKPDDQGIDGWRPVPMAEIDKLDDSLRESKKLKRKTAGTGRLAAFIAIVVGIMVILFAKGEGRTDIAFYLLNILAFFVPAVFFGRVAVFTPFDIDKKMPCFRAILAESLPPDVAIAPYICFDKDARGAGIPQDLRVMYELKRPPVDLVGIQVQASINNGPNGAVPYMYAVVLTKGKSGSSFKIAERAKLRGYVVEPGGDEEYGTVVIRQETGGSGYETTPKECLRLREICLKFLKEMGASA